MPYVFCDFEKSTALVCWKHFEAIERADIDTEFTSCAVIDVYYGNWPVLRADFVRKVPDWIADAGNRAVGCADAAIDAQIRRDNMEFLVVASDATVDRAGFEAHGAPNTVLRDKMRHSLSPF
jgi:hypothetical protein